MTKPTLILHSGAEVCTLDQLRAVETPAATETWTPVPHHRFLELVTENVTGLGLTIHRQELGLWHHGARFFGVLDLRNGKGTGDYGLAVGVRNSHDMSFSAGFACGAHVFCCDNLSFSAEIVMKRKHTSRIEGDLARLVSEGIGRLGGMRRTMDHRLAAYKQAAVTDGVAHDVMIRAVDAGVIAVTRIGPVLEQWRDSTHEEFRARTAWSLFNAFTAVLKTYNQLELPRRSIALHGLMDQVAGVDPERN